MIYLSQPVSIQETMLDLGASPLVTEVTWRKKDGKHYSLQVAVFHWASRGGYKFKFETGTQWGDKRDILVVGHLL